MVILIVDCDVDIAEPSSGISEKLDPGYPVTVSTRDMNEDGGWVSDPAPSTTIRTLLGTKAVGVISMAPQTKASQLLTSRKTPGEKRRAKAVPVLQTMS